MAKGTILKLYSSICLPAGKHLSMEGEFFDYMIGLMKSGAEDDELIEELKSNTDKWRLIS